MIVQQAVIRQIICPVCDAAVRPADETPCPNCRTCPSCGRKLPRGEPTCWCGFSDEPEKVAELVRRFGVSDEYAELAARKFASRKRLERKKSLVICALGALMIVPNVILGGSRHFQSVGDFVVDVMITAAVFGPLFYAFIRWQNREEERLRREFPEQSTDCR